MSIKIEFTGLGGKMIIESHKDLDSNDWVLLSTTFKKVLSENTKIVSKSSLVDEGDDHWIEYRPKFRKNMVGRIIAIKIMRKYLGITLRSAKNIVDNKIPCPWLTKEKYSTLVKILHNDGVTDYMKEICPTSL